MAKIYHEHDRSIPPFDEHFGTPGFLPVTPALISVADDVTGIPNIMPAVGWGWLNRLPFYLGVAVSVEEHTSNTTSAAPTSCCTAPGTSPSTSPPTGCASR